MRVLVIALIALASASGSMARKPDLIAASRAKFDSWTVALNAKRFDEAAAMMVGPAVVKNVVTGERETIAARFFVESITRCRAEDYPGSVMPPLKDGSFTKSFYLKCEARDANGGFITGSFPVRYGFYVQASVKGIRVYG